MLGQTEVAMLEATISKSNCFQSKKINLLINRTQGGWGPGQRKIMIGLVIFFHWGWGLDIIKNTAEHIGSGGHSQSLVNLITLFWV